MPTLESKSIKLFVFENVPCNVLIIMNTIKSGDDEVMWEIYIFIWILVPLMRAAVPLKKLELSKWANIVVHIEYVAVY